MAALILTGLDYAIGGMPYADFPAADTSGLDAAFGGVPFYSEFTDTGATGTSSTSQGQSAAATGALAASTTADTSQGQSAAATGALAASTTADTSQGQSAAATGALAASTTADTSQGQSAAVTADAEPNLPNLIDISEGFDQAYWANTIATLVDPDVSVSPVGTTTVDEATFNFTGNSNLRAHVTGLTIGETYTFSAWVQSGRSGSATHVRLAANNLSAWGTASSVKQALTGSLVRISTSWVQTGTTSAALLIGTPDETGAGDSDCLGTARVWGAMFNTGGVRAAYLKTPADIDVVADTSQGQSAAALMSVAQDAIVSVAQGQSAAATGALAASTTADTSQGQSVDAAGAIAVSAAVDTGQAQSASALMSIGQDAIVSVAQGQTVDAAADATGGGIGVTTGQGQSVAAMASVSIDATVGTSQGQSVVAGTTTVLDAAVDTSQGQSAAATGALAASVSSSTLQGQSTAALMSTASDAIVSVAQGQSVSGLASASLVDQVRTSQGQSAAALMSIGQDAIVSVAQGQSALGAGNLGTDMVAATAQGQSISALAYSYEGGVDHMRSEWRVLVTYRGDARLLVELANEVSATLIIPQHLATNRTDDVVTLA